MKYAEIPPFFWITTKGFTLIELIVVFGALAVITSIGMSGYSQFNRTQTIQTAAVDVANIISIAKSRTASQYAVNRRDFQGYDFYANKNTKKYSLRRWCGPTPTQVVPYQYLELGKYGNYHFEFSKDCTTAVSYRFYPLSGGFKKLCDKGGGIFTDYKDEIQIVNASSTQMKKIIVDPAGGAHVE